jgi:hypothetical protein
MEAIMPDPTSQPTKRNNRRWLQFSLRTMLIMTALISAWLAFVFIPAQRADRATKALQEKGMSVSYDFQHVPGTSPYHYSSRVPQPGPAFLRKLFGDGLFQHAESISRDHSVVKADDLSPLEAIPTIRSVSLAHCQIGDEHLKHLAGLQHLELLNVGKGQITERGLSNLAHLTELRTLDLSDNQIHGDGLKHLSSLTKLTWLFLYGNPISDDSLANFERLTNLEMLGLSGKNITDEGLKHLANLKKLQYLSVGGTKVTREGAMKLQAELPNCYIEPFSPQDHAWLQALNAKGRAEAQAIQDDIKCTNAYIQKLTGGGATSK